MTEKTLLIEDLALIPYEEAWELQRRYHADVVAGHRPDTLLLCSHHPVLTLGSSSKEEHLLHTPEQLEQLGLQVLKVERGGSVTYHGPEQVIGYPILNLTLHKRDVGWYMRSLEEVILRTLATLGFQGMRVPGKTGVWTDEHSKIAFIGVKISRWCTYHGFSLNVIPCQRFFGLVNPCGLGKIRVISLSDLAEGAFSIPVVKSQVVAHFTEVFGYARRSTLF